MKITTIGRAAIGGTLAQLWTSAGHEVVQLGRDGGDAADADVVLLAVPYSAVADALAGVTGLDGKVIIDATNRLGGETPPSGYASNTEYVRAQTADPSPRRSTSTSDRCSTRLPERRPGRTTCGPATKTLARPPSNSAAISAWSRSTAARWSMPPSRRPSPSCSWRSSRTSAMVCSSTGSHPRKASEEAVPSLGGIAAGSRPGACSSGGRGRRPPTDPARADREGRGEARPRDRCARPGSVRRQSPAAPFGPHGGWCWERGRVTAAERDARWALAGPLGGKGGRRHRTVGQDSHVH